MKHGLTPPYQHFSSVNDLVDWVETVEEYDYSHIGYADSQSLFPEVYTTLSLLATKSESLNFGPFVSNPITRHPAVTASATATLNAIAPGRVFLGIASGDSAIYTLGKRPAKLETLDESIRLIKSLWQGDSEYYNQTPIKLEWVEEMDYDQNIPLWMAAEGPKSLRLAGRVSDGVVIGLGLLPEIIETAIEWIHEGAQEEGRDIEEIDIWLLSKTNLGDDYESSIDEIKMALAASAHHSLQFSMEKKMVPSEYKEQLQKIVDRYDSKQHEQLGENPNRDLVERLNITDYLAKRYAIAGTPNDGIKKIKQIEEVDDVDGIMHSTWYPKTTDILGSEVIPNL